MARQNGILKIEGTLKNSTFYKTQDGNLIKTKGMFLLPVLRQPQPFRELGKTVQSLVILLLVESFIVMLFVT